MTPAEEALATLTGFQSLLLEGKTLRADVAKVMRDASVERAIDGVSTLTLELYDDARKLLNSGLFSERTTMSVDDYSFELVQVRKSGPGLTVVLEDLPVAALRRHDEPVKVAPNTTTHVDFSERLVKEEGWLKFWTPAEARTGERAKVELARGTPAAEGQEAEKEDTWAAIGRLADERGWRRYVRNKNTIAYVPETYLLAQPPAYRFSETTGGVDYIDFDFDIGKPVATVKVKVRASRWAVPVGSCVEITGLGPVNGKWLVSSISRSLFDLSLDVTLTKARPVLPEPEPPPAPSATELGPESGAASSGAPAVGGGAASSSGGYVWPVRGRISSGFGPRPRPGGIGSSNHKGVDIAAGSGTRVNAAKAGTVIFAGVAGGYGNAVYVDHGGGVVTRYAHLNRISTRRGVRVAQGEQVGTVGMTGTATGPHLHFEVRVGGTARDPMRYLP